MPDSAQTWSFATCWSRSVKAAALHPLSKLVCFNLLLDRWDADASAPSILQQMHETGLSRSDLAEHLRAAVDAGFVALGEDAAGRMQYLLTFPGSSVRGTPVNQGGSSPKRHEPLLAHVKGRRSCETVPLRGNLQ